MLGKQVIYSLLMSDFVSEKSIPTSFYEKYVYTARFTNWHCYRPLQFFIEKLVYCDFFLSKQNQENFANQKYGVHQFSKMWKNDSWKRHSDDQVKVSHELQVKTDVYLYNRIMQKPAHAYDDDKELLVHDPTDG